MGPSGYDLAIVAGIAVDHGWRMPVLVGLGGLLSLLLYHASFGFTAAYRRLFVARETAVCATTRYILIERRPRLTLQRSLAKPQLLVG